MTGAQPIEDFDFPPELLLIIKELVEDWDLRTHVCFYLSSPKVAALYDSSKHPDAFWRLACWNNGLTGGPTDVVDSDDDDEEMRDNTQSHHGGPSPWRDVAVDCIARDGFCTHPHCGEALLEYNRQCMREVQEDVQVFKPIHSRSEDDSLSPLIAHQVFEHIEFKQFSDVFRRSRVEDDAHLRTPGDSPRRGADLNYMNRPDDYPGMYLAEHPLVAGSFATSPPVDSVMLLHLIGRPLPGGIVVQTGPVTVLDIVSAIHEGLDVPLAVDEAGEHISLHGRCIPKDWPLEHVFGMMGSARSILSICPLTSLEYQEATSHGPAFAFYQL